MPIEIRPPRADEWDEVCRVDGRAFGHSYTAEEIEQSRPIHDVSRFRVAIDGRSIVGVAGSYAMDATLPGGASVPMGAVTWVSVAATHRRQGLMRRLVGAVHDDIDERGEPVASLYASEGGIYDHVGYGASTQVRVTALDTRRGQLRAGARQPSGSVRYLADDEIVPVSQEVWTRFSRLRAGEIHRSHALHEYLAERRRQPADGLSGGAFLAHPDGVAVYRMEPHWNDGQPAHVLHLAELAAVTPEAHAALWQTLLSIDLVGEIRSRAVPIDDPLPHLLDNPRALRTTALNDGVWVNVRDVAIAFAARTYRSVERIVVEADGVRWAIEGGPDGGSCRRVRTRADLITDHSGLSALLYGGVSVTALVGGRRMTARNADAVRRADMFFTTALAPHCQTGY